MPIVFTGSFRSKHPIILVLYIKIRSHGKLTDGRKWTCLSHPSSSLGLFHLRSSGGRNKKNRPLPSTYFNFFTDHPHIFIYLWLTTPPPLIYIFNFFGDHPLHIFIFSLTTHTYFIFFAFRPLQDLKWNSPYLSVYGITHTSNRNGIHEICNKTAPWCVSGQILTKL